MVNVDCQERCQYKISGCNYFSYEKGTKKCELKRGKSKPVTRESVTSGPKYCPNDYDAAKTSEFLPRNGAEWEIIDMQNNVLLNHRD